MSASSPGTPTSTLVRRDPTPRQSVGTPSPVKSVAPRRTTRLRTSWLGWLLLAAALFLTVIWPTIMLCVGAFRSDTPLNSATWTLDGFAELGGAMTRGGALTNSVVLACASTVLGIALALALALLAERTDTAGRWLIRPVVMISVATSAMFYAMGYSQLGNEYTGVVNTVASSLFGVGPIVNVESWLGLICVDSLHASAYVYLFLVGPVRQMNRSYEEAAFVAGAGRWRIIRTVSTPLLTPILLSTILIGLISGLQSFDGPLILGTPANLNFLGTRIWSLISDENPPKFGVASAIAIVLLVVLMLLAVVQARLLRNRNFVTVTGKSYRSDVWRLGKARWLTGGFVVLYTLFAVVLPFGAVIITSFQPFPGVWQSLSLQNYEQLWQNPNVAPAVINTILVAILGGVLATTIAVVVSTVAARSRHPAVGSTLRATTLLPLAMPGVVAAIAVTWAYASVPGLRAIYGTVWLLLIAVVVTVLPVTVQIASGAVRQLDPDLERAALVAGASRFRVTRTITVRLLLPSLLSSWFLAAVLIGGNLDAPLILSSNATRTISTLTYEMFSSQNQGQAAALLTLTVAGLLGVGAVIGLAISVSRALAGRTVADAESSKTITQNLSEAESTL